MDMADIRVLIQGDPGRDFQHHFHRRLQLCVGNHALGDGLRLTVLLAKLKAGNDIHRIGGPGDILHHGHAAVGLELHAAFRHLRLTQGFADQVLRARRQRGIEAVVLRIGRFFQLRLCVLLELQLRDLHLVLALCKVDLRQGRDQLFRVHRIGNTAHGDAAVRLAAGDLGRRGLCATQKLRRDTDRDRPHGIEGGVVHTRVVAVVRHAVAVGGLDVDGAACKAHARLQFLLLVHDHGLDDRVGLVLRGAAVNEGQVIEIERAAVRLRVN